MGAIVIEPNAAVPADVFISDSCTFTSNSATSDGGAIVAQTGASVAITDSKFSLNTAGGYGGGVYVYKGALTVDYSTLANNTGDYGGGAIYDYGGKVVVSDSCSMTSNSGTTAEASGGASWKSGRSLGHNQ